jgi:hypothetical protein|tara:strand:- start:92 stop:412 length:321 start_codon:yes stop_codon:yes gene_type:complete
MPRWLNSKRVYKIDEDNEDDFSSNPTDVPTPEEKHKAKNRYMWLMRYLSKYGKEGISISDTIGLFKKKLKRTDVPINETYNSYGVPLIEYKKVILDFNRAMVYVAE